MKKIIVTWWCGFIGSNFLNQWVHRHPDIRFINIDSLTYAWLLDNIDLSVRNATNYTFYQVDIRDIKALRMIYTKEHPTDCIHFAAESHVDNSLQHPNIFLETNVLGTNNLLMLHKDCGLQRFHFISTDEVYGDLPLENPERKFTEDTPLHPHSPYSVSKASADMLVQSYHRTYGIDTTTTRCSNNYWPRQHQEKVIPRFIGQLHAWKKIPLYWDGKHVRDRIYVDDHNTWVRTVFTRAPSWAIYNLWWNTELSNRELTTILLEAFGKDEASIEYISDRLGHDRRYAIDFSKISTDLGRQPQISFNKGIATTINWYRDRYKNHC